MARFTFSINGLIDLEPISFDKVDKFYSTQNEFLRDSSVLTSTSRYSEMLHLATFAFDVSKAEEVNKLSTLIATKANKFVHESVLFSIKVRLFTLHKS